MVVSCGRELVQSRKGGLALPSRGHFVNVGRREESLSCLLAYMFHYKISLFFFFFYTAERAIILRILKLISVNMMV